MIEATAPHSAADLQRGLDTGRIGPLVPRPATTTVVTLAQAADRDGAPLWQHRCGQVHAWPEADIERAQCPRCGRTGDWAALYGGRPVRTRVGGPS